MELNNNVAIVTGSSKGIGLEVVKQLLAKGMKVAGWSRSKTDLSHEHFKWIKCDVGDEHSVEKAFATTQEHFGDQLQVLVNNAGIGYKAKLEDTPVKQWQQMMNVNVNGIFYCTRLALPLMKKMQQGHIINISSIAGTTGVENMSGYAATKFAVKGISHSLYKEVRQEGIKVTCVYPGSVSTHFFNEIDGIQANEHMMRPQDVAETIVHALTTHQNFHIVDIEMRPLKPKG